MPEHEKQQLRDVGFSEEDIGISIMLRNGCPDGDIIHFGLPRLEGESEDAYDARYKAAIRRGDYLCHDTPRLPEQDS